MTMNYEIIAGAANNIDNIIRENAALKSVIIDASTTLLDDKSVETRQSIQEFLDAPLDSKKDIAMKKAFAAAMVIAKEKGIIDLPDNTAEIASIVDEGLVRVKANYKVGAGLLNPEEAIDNIIDHAEARAITYIDYAFDSGLVREVATEGIVKIAYRIPKIGPIIGLVAERNKPIIRSVIAMVEQPAKTAIKTGIHVVSSFSKKVAHVAIARAKELAVNTARNLVSWLA